MTPYINIAGAGCYYHKPSLMELPCATASMIILYNSTGLLAADAEALLALLPKQLHSSSLDAPFTAPTQPPRTTLVPGPKKRECELTTQKPTDAPDDDLPNHAGMNVLEKVPPDALHILIPVWLCNTDNSSTIPGEDNAKYIVPVEERQYLVVFYL